LKFKYSIIFSKFKIGNSKFCLDYITEEEEEEEEARGYSRAA
jgi:hypothetical protein